MAVTLADIAKLAKVSESSVSRALQDHPRISVATRERVKKIATELDFEYNAHARSLSTKRSGTIGVILSNFRSQANHVYYLDLLLNELRFQLSVHNLDILVCESEQHSSEDSNLSRLVRQRKVDGLILVIGELPEKDRKIIERKHIPIVLINSCSLLMLGEPIQGIPSFFTDNQTGGGMAAEHLIQKSRHRLLCIADKDGGPEMIDRTTGFLKVAKDLGVSAEIMSCGSDFASTQSFILDKLEIISRYDGIFCHTDVMACAVLQTCKNAGLRIPEDMAIVGFDDIELGTYFSPQLTTIRQPREELAEHAVQDLVSRIGDREVPPVVHLSVSPTLVPRGST